MSGLNFSEWGVVAHKDDTGFGRLAQDMRAVLGIGRHIVIPSLRLHDKPLSGDGSEIILRPDDPTASVELALSGLKGIIFFEHANWHPSLLPVAKRMGLSTVCQPMWEWFSTSNNDWQLCDLFACPTMFSEKILRSLGFQNSIYVAPPTDISRFPARQINASARLFIHNAGLIDHDDRKGTRDTINAFGRVKRDDIKLIVRMQKEVQLPPFDSRVQIEVGSKIDPAELYASGEVAIQPSKMEGIGLMVIEPMLSGMPVITTDYPPMNEFIRTRELLVAKQWLKRRALATNWVKHAHLRLPDPKDLSRKIEWCTNHDLSEISKSNRALAEQIFAPQKLRQQWSEILQALEENRLIDYLHTRVRNNLRA